MEYQWIDLKQYSKLHKIHYRTALRKFHEKTLEDVHGYETDITDRIRTKYKVKVISKEASLMLEFESFRSMINESVMKLEKIIKSK